MNEYTNDGRGLDWYIHITYATKQITLLQSKTTWNDSTISLHRTYSSYESEIGGIVNILNTAFTIVISA